MEIFISIGERLRDVRTAMGLSQTEFAEIAAAAGVPGATRQSQANYEKGRQVPSAAYMAALAAAGVDVLYVLTGQRMNSGEAPSGPAVNRREQALLDNYRHAPEEGRDAIERTALALAKSATAVKKSQGAA